MTRVTFDCERLKYEHTGLFHYCKSLSLSLIRTRPANCELQVYTAGKRYDIYPQGTRFVASYPWHKIYNTAYKGCDLWHAAHQDTEYFPFKKSLKKVLTIHDLNYFNDPSKPAYKKKRNLDKIKRLLEGSEYLICISEFTINEIKKHINLSIPYKVIYNGHNIDYNLKETKPATPVEGPFLFTIGTVTDKKNFHVLPGMLAGNDYNLVIAGIFQKQSYLQKIKDEAKKFGVESRVFFSGGISESEKYWYYKHCSAFVFPSLQEGFGLPVLEAMAFGKLLFLSTKTALPEVGGKDAFFFENFDPGYMSALLAEKMAHFNANAAEITGRLIQRSQLFSWDRAAMEHWEIYKKVLGIV